MTGQRFGRLLVLSYSHTEKKASFWNCRCDCGKLVTPRRGGLMSGDNISCGCYTKERLTTHGMEGTRFYRAWRGMIARCNDKNRDSYNRYGGRGIKVCDEWLHSFETFRDDMQEGYTDKLQLDRIDTDGNYEKSNCKWSTPKENSNNKSNNRYITIEGETLTLTQWCRRYNANYFNVWALIDRGHEPQEALAKHSK